MERDESFFVFRKVKIKIVWKKVLEDGKGQCALEFVIKISIEL